MKNGIRIETSHRKVTRPDENGIPMQVEAVTTDKVVTEGGAIVSKTRRRALGVHARRATAGERFVEPLYPETQDERGATSTSRYETQTIGHPKLLN